jgi:ABC-type Zn uptake system ZnuABC Zn-binding protein ZnuA
MRLADWVVLCGALAFIVLYGLWRGRGSNSVNKYLLAGRTMPWHLMALSIMATQASAVTFISTTGQSYVDGMRFVQFYFGLPLAMVVLSVTAVPIFHRANVYTAYEYLEQRFDAKTRALVSAIFLIQRGLALGITLYAPAVVLTVILGWPDWATTLVMGGVAVTYTTLGGVKAIAWTDLQQMLVMTAGLVAALGRAELYFSSGFPFERSFIRNLADGGAGIRVVHTESGILGSQGQGHTSEKHGAGESNASGHDDPHIWLSPTLLRIQANTICDALKAGDPLSASIYQGNLDRFLSDLDTLDHWTARTLAPYRGRTFLVFHPSFGRFAEAYGLRQIAIEMEGKSPSPRQLSAFVNTARRENIRAVFVEPQFESRSAKAVADAIGGRIEWMDPMARDIFGSLRSFTLALVRAFKEADAAAGREPR